MLTFLLLLEQLWSLFYHHSTVDTNILLASLPDDLQSIIQNDTFNHQETISIPMVILYRNKSNINLNYENIISLFTKSMFSTHDLLEWIVRNIHGLIAQRTPESELTLHRPNFIGTSVVIYHTNHTDSQNNLRNLLIPIAKFHWNIFFSLASFHLFKETLLHEYKLTVHEQSSLSSSSSSSMIMIIVYDSLGIPFAMNASYSLDNINHFIDQFKSGDIESSLSVSETFATKNIISRVNKYSYVKYITCINIHRMITFQKIPILLIIYRSTDDIESQVSFTQLAKSLSSSSSSTSNVIVSVLNVDHFNRLPIELRFHSAKPVYLLIIEKEDRFMWKQIIRFKGDLKQGVDSLVAFTRDQVKRKPKTTDRVKTNISFTSKQQETLSMMKSEL